LLTRSLLSLFIADVQWAGDLKCFSSSPLLMEEYSGGWLFCLVCKFLNESSRETGFSYLNMTVVCDFTSGIDCPFLLLFDLSIPLFWTAWAVAFGTTAFALSFWAEAFMFKVSLQFFLIKNEKWIWSSSKCLTILLKVTAAQISSSRNLTISSS
jgi:hypothetical protein